ncbi:MAG: GGDEF domain-containing protein [Aquabacterium sp.]
MRSAIVYFLVAGSALLSLSLVAKWVTEIRVKISRQAKRLQAAIVRVEEMATHDMLTGALNRRVGTELAEAELRQVERQAAHFCVALLDLDHFKQINDGRGHQVGDAVLVALADHVRAQLRQVDKVARWGGEEFLILLPSVTLEQAQVALDRVRDGFAALRLVQHPDLCATFSVGLAQARAGDTLEHLLERADHALYEAKRQGRNRCVAEAPSRDGPASVASTPEFTS